MAQELNIPRHSHHAARGRDRRTRRIDESRTWVRPYVNPVEVLEKEDKINLNSHPDDFTKVAWTKDGIRATRDRANQASILTARMNGGLCTQTITGQRTEKAFLSHIKRITGTGRVDITVDGVTWVDVTRRISRYTFTRVSTKVQTLEHCIIGFRLKTDKDAIAVHNAQCVEL